MNYAAAAASSNGPKAQQSVKPSQPKPAAAPAPATSKPAVHAQGERQRRAPSPSHIPKTTQSGNQTDLQEEETVYVLTLLTDKAHHARMTEFRKRYFPPRLNKLDAHLTLFHALPASKLAGSVVPTLERVAAATAPFEVHATRPFRLKKGIAIAVPKTKGGAEAQEVHARLQESWAREGWLSDQDAQKGMQVHYTIMNKVDEEEEVARALEEVKGFWKTDVGTAEGLGLWRYEKGWWKWERGFEFQKQK